MKNASIDIFTLMAMAERDLAELVAADTRHALGVHGAACHDAHRLASDAMNAEFVEFCRHAPKPNRGYHARSVRRSHLHAMAILFPGIN